MRSLVLAIAIALCCATLAAQQVEYETVSNIQYREDGVDDYARERCVLDIYYPKNSSGFATLVWFHGGGLQNGNKHIPERLKNEGIAIVAVNYRMNPQVTAPIYIEDAAASVAWIFKHIGEYGGARDKIFVSGHSAGGYLASMVGLDKHFLANLGIDANDIAGLIPLSGQCVTHSTVREERGIGMNQVVVDELAPLFHARADAPPLLLITGNRELEIPARHEENILMWRMMKVAGHEDTRLFELDGYGHSMTEPAFPLVLEEIRRVAGK